MNSYKIAICVLSVIVAGENPYDDATFELDLRRTPSPTPGRASVDDPASLAQAARREALEQLSLGKDIPSGDSAVEDWPPVAATPKTGQFGSSMLQDGERRGPDEEADPIASDEELDTGVASASNVAIKPLLIRRESVPVASKISESRGAREVRAHEHSSGVIGNRSALDLEEEQPESSASRGSNSLDDAAQGKRKNCPAPVHIPFALTPSCQEGKVIEAGQWCTPRCAVRKMAFINMKEAQKDAMCLTGGPQWGTKLCCNKGELHPLVFHCISDIFDLMDLDRNGVISKTEYEIFENRAMGKDKEARAEEDAAKAAERAPQDEMANELAKEEAAKNVNREEDESSEEAEKEANCTTAACRLKEDDKKSKKKAEKENVKEQRASIRWSVIVLTVTLIILALLTGIFLTATLLGGKPKEVNPKDDPEVEELRIRAQDILFAEAELDELRIRAADILLAQAEGETGPPKRLLLECSLESKAGEYVMEEDQKPNGYPLWKRVDSEDYLFSGKTGNWFFGDADEKELNFDCDTGSITSANPHYGQYPHAVSDAGWLAFEGGEWKPDPSIKVTVVADPETAAADGETAAADGAAPAVADGAETH